VGIFTSVIGLESHVLRSFGRDRGQLFVITSRIPAANGCRKIVAISQFVRRRPFLPTLLSGVAQRYWDDLCREAMESRHAHPAAGSPRWLSQIRRIAPQSFLKESPVRTPSDRRMFADSRRARLLFLSLAGVRQKVENWRTSADEERPCGAIARNRRLCAKPRCRNHPAAAMRGAIRSFWVIENAASLQ